MEFDCGGNLEKMFIIGEESTVKNLKGRQKILLSGGGGWGGGEKEAISSGQMLLTGGGGQLCWLRGHLPLQLTC